jgi:DNA (cytosine-5)-methyltransferase 1
MFPYYGSTETGRTLDRPLGTITTTDRWALVMGDRLRMITPTEARAGMGFPDTYLLPKKPKRAAMKMLGNAVCPPAAKHVITHAAAKLHSFLAAGLN